MPVDILVLGATGFTGRLIVRRLHNHPEHSSFTFAIGARSKAKGEALINSLGVDSTVPVVEINLSRYDEVEKVVKDAKVILNVAGPFWLWGQNVVRACAANGKRYVDLTGEPYFVRRIIDHYDALATKTGAIIVPACGFDSIPADLLVHLSNRTLKNALGPQAQLGLSQTFYDLVGGVSGGSLATLLTGIEQFKDIPARRLLLQNACRSTSVPDTADSG
ncbi:Saccharopine dehydrogenase-domain-containing protein [Fomes fomentarius]|nr:Saccharopine dehydrogenase-domain-containing protein [Fomes fomentarius]